MAGARFAGVLTSPSHPHHLTECVYVFHVQKALCQESVGTLHLLPHVLHGASIIHMMYIACEVGVAYLSRWSRGLVTMGLQFLTHLILTMDAGYVIGCDIRIVLKWSTVLHNINFVV